MSTHNYEALRPDFSTIVLVRLVEQADCHSHCSTNTRHRSISYTLAMYQYLPSYLITTQYRLLFYLEAMLSIRSFGGAPYPTLETFVSLWVVIQKI